MSNVMLGFPNRGDAATLSGGSWVAGLPLTNLQNRVVGKVARSTNVQITSTKFDIDCLVSKNIRIVSLVNHNLTLPALARIRASAVSNFATTVYDSGWIDVWPELYPYGTLEWEDDNWWSGSYVEEDVAGYTTNFLHLLPANKLARYWRIEFDNQTNSANYIQLGRLFMSPAWQPAINMLTGASLGWESKTDITEALSGAEYFNRRTPYRVQRFTLGAMTDDEAFAVAFEIQRKAGVDKELIFIHDPAGTFHSLRKRFLCRMRQLGAIEYPQYNLRSAAFELKELI